MTDLTLDGYRHLAKEELEQMLKQEAGEICGSHEQNHHREDTDSLEKIVILNALKSTLDLKKRKNF